MQVVGIDLGTTNTLACYFLRGKKKLLKFPGEVSTMLPSVIYTDEDGKVIVGQMAVNRGEINPSRMIRSAKTYIGNVELNKTWKHGKKIYTPTDVAIEVLKAVRERFVKVLKLDENEEIGAVITVPAYFNDNQRDETRKAGEAAGFRVMWILEEPAAAAIEAIHEMELEKKVLVVDIGGGTFDLSVLEADHENNVYEAIAIDGDDRLGGDDFDEAIKQEFIRHIEDDTGLKFTDAKSAGLDEARYQLFMTSLLKAARKAKEDLSETTETEVNVPNLTTLGGKDYSLDFTFTRKALEMTCKPLFDKIFKQINDFAKNNKKFKLQDIGHVILAGGTCFIPRIREQIEKDLGIKPDDDLPLSQLVVSGAARVAEGRASGLSGDGSTEKPIKVKSILAHSLGIEILNKQGALVFDKIIAKDTPYPCNVEKEYVTTFDNQTQIEVHVYEAGKEDERDVKFHRFRGSLVLKDLPPAKKGKTKITVKFAYTEDQRLMVTVIDKQNVHNAKEAFLDKTAKSKPQVSGAEPVDMVLMLDSSGSMMGSDIAQAKAACEKLITEMIDLSVHRMALMNFDSYSYMLCHLTNDKDALTKKLSKIEATGSTEMVGAFRAAYNELANSTRRKIALMVTDGYPDYAEETVSYVNSLRKKDLTIIAIGVGKGFNKSFLDKMVGAKNAFTVEKMSELSKIFKHVMNAITTGNL